MPERKERAEVKVGQVWADNDPRSVGRTIKVIAIGTHSARCETLTPVEGSSRDSVGKTRMVALDRFRPTTNGYRLIKDVPSA